MSLRILYFGTYDNHYLHNRLMIQGLRIAGAEVFVCHVPLWRNTEDKVAAANGYLSVIRLGIRSIHTYFRLLRKYYSMHIPYDVMMLGYTGQFDVFLARLLSWTSRRPLVLDVLMSLFLIASERKLASRNLLRWIEYAAYRLPNMLILDTPEQAEWFEQTYGIQRSRFHLVPLGADENFFKPLPSKKPDGKFRALYYGTFIPLHGVEYIIRAAELLRERKQFEFLLIGRGPERAKAKTLVLKLGLQNVIFHEWVPLEDLPRFVAECDVLLGVFGITEQSKRTIQNKIYQGLAMAKPVITGDAPAVRSTLTHRVHAYLVERGSPDALANAIVSLESNPVICSQMAEAGYHLFREQFTVEAIGRRTLKHIEEILMKVHRTRSQNQKT